MFPVKTFTYIRISAGNIFTVIPLPREQSTSVSAAESGKTKVKDKDTKHTRMQGMCSLEDNMCVCVCVYGQISKSCHFSFSFFEAREKKKALAMVLPVYFLYQVKYFSVLPRRLFICWMELSFCTYLQSSNYTDFRQLNKRALLQTSLFRRKTERMNFLKSVDLSLFCLFLLLTSWTLRGCLLLMQA